MTGPSDEELLAAGGAAGRSRLLIRRELDRVTVAIVDTNDDGVLLVVVTFHRDEDGVWRETGHVGAGTVGEGRASGTGYAYGHAPGADAVEVGFRGEFRSMPVNEHGWWLVLEDADEGERFDLSRAPGWVAIRRRPGPPRIAG